MLTTDSPGEGKRDAIFAIALDGGEKRQLTFPPASAFLDMDPAVSPDGRVLIFRRDLTPFTGDFYRLSLKDRYVPDGEAIRVTSAESSSATPGKPSWMPDSREVLFSAKGALWRLDVLSDRAPTRLPFVGQDGVSPVAARRPDGRVRLVFVHSFTDSNIWRVDTSAAGVPASSPPVAAIASTRSDSIPNLSDDGRRIAFLSNRSGESELWVADLDGSNAAQLTSVASFPGFPRWSPDGNLVALHSDPNKRPDVVVVPASGGKHRVVTTETAGGAFPSFSRDGLWIYFSAVSNGQVWKIPAAGGAAVQVTTNIGTIAIESPDGRDLYYAEAADRPTALWRQTLSGGAPVKVLDGILMANFAVIDRGIYYIDRASGETGSFFTERFGRETRLQYFDFATRRATTVAHSLGIIGPGLSASRDGRLIIFSRVDASVDELMVVENVR